MKPMILPLSDTRADLETAGGKGASLTMLLNAGLPVPNGFHITTEVYRQFVAANKLQAGIDAALEQVDPSRPASLESASREIARLFSKAAIPDEIEKAILDAYLSLSTADDKTAVAVRSSANAEDLPEASFAGQQETFLNISGADQVLSAVRDCWTSLWTARAIGYRARHNIPSESVVLGVVVQLLIKADAAGILFTANPLNGSRDEIVINAAWGLGEAVVGGAVTPDILTLRKADLKVIHRETADKQVMTSRIESGTADLPVPEAMRNAQVIDDEMAARLAQLGLRIEKLFGGPMDIEWALAGGEFSILQARPVTAMGTAPVEWKGPDPKGVYMRASVVDLMPNPLSPLFATWGIESMRRQMQPLGKKLTGLNPILPEDYFTSINQYAYGNAHLPLKSTGWILFGLLPAMGKLIRRMGAIWREEFYPQYHAFAVGLRDLHPSEMSTEELWKTSQTILDQAAYYVTGLLFATLGASAGSELATTSAYNKFARREGDPEATTLLMGWDNTPIRAEKSLYDLAMWARGQEALAAYLLETPAAVLVEQIPPFPVTAEDVIEMGFVPVSGWEEFVSRFHAHLEQFGYIVYQLDFAEPLPLERPNVMLENIKMYLRGEGANPHERQRMSEQRRIETTESTLARLKGFKRWAFRSALKWGQSMAEIREDALAEIGLGYPMLRRLLLELGGRFVKDGAIEKAGDVFLLHGEEIGSLVFGQKMVLIEKVKERAAFWRRMQKEIPPPMIPFKKRIMGVKTDVYVAHSEDEQSGNLLKGNPSSSGKVTAQACILLGPDDFEKMRPGCVLVAGTTTPAWTPLFSMASAVVTDIGGPLSHGSIVAREYGIPAVMGTGVATRRIQDGQVIMVDGNAGIVTLL